MATSSLAYGADMSQIKGDESDRQAEHMILNDIEKPLDEASEHAQTERITYSPDEEKKLLRKLDWRLLPLMAFTYGLAFYDKVMMGQAVLFGLRKDLDLVKPAIRYSMANSIFYAGYVCGLPLIGLLTQRFPLGKSCAVLVLIWGITCMLTVACNNYPSILAQRFFLGFIEAGIAPSFVQATAIWFTKREQALRATVWVAAAPATNMFSPMINYGFGSIKGPLSGWQNMYLFAGSLTISWSLIIWWRMPDGIQQAKFLSEREKEIAEERIRRVNGGSRSHTVKWDQVKEAFLDINVWGLFLLAVGAYFASGVLQSFSSLIIADLGYSTIENLAVQIPKGFVGVLANLIPGYYAMKYPGLRFHIYTVAVTMAFAGSIALLLAPRVPGLLGALYGLHFFGAAAGQVHGLNASNVGGYTKRTVATCFTFVGYSVAQVAAPLLFSTADAPKYTRGFAATMSLTAMGMIWSQVHRYILRRRNMKRDKEGEANNERGLEDITDFENRDFRYAL